MKIRNMIGLAMLGGFLYAHQRRGGSWSLDSFKTTARDLWDTFLTKPEAKQAARDVAAKIQTEAGAVAHKLDDAGRHLFGGNGPMRR